MRFSNGNAQMNANEGDLIEAAPQLDDASDADREVSGHRGQVLGILIAAIVFAELAKDLIYATDRGDWLPACVLLYYGLLACLPLLLARIAPEAAGFDVQWLSNSQRQWAWFLGMVFAAFLAKVLSAALATAIAGPPSPPRVVGPTTPTGILFLGIGVVLGAPVAEEIFFRGYLLDQLTKVTRSANAVVMQSLLFGLFHLYTYGLFTSFALVISLNAFMLGMIAGAWRIKFRSLLPLVLVHMLVNCTTIISLKARFDQAVDWTRPIRYTVSKETTYLTGPLWKDGSVDYVAALNERASRGVTPENNAAVLFWKAVGPEEILPEYRDEYFHMLGMAPLPQKGNYFVRLEAYLAQRDGAKPDDYDTYALLRPVLERPWSEEEFPDLAAWLAANEEPLALLVEASKRPWRYDPLVCGEKTPLIAVLQPATDLFRDVCRAVVARAMLRLGEDEVDESWDDVLACHRLARLVGQGPMLVEGLAAYALDQTASAGDQALLQRAHLAASHAAKMREDLDRLSAMPKMADKLDVADRFTYLDNASVYSRQGVTSLAGFEEVPGLEELSNTIKSLLHYGAGTPIDWDLTLRMGNAWFDRLADAYRKPTRAERKKAVSMIDEDFRRLKKTAADAKSLDKLMRSNPRKALSERFGQVFLAMFLPPITLYVDVEDRWTMRFELDKLGFALAAYRADRGAYPAKLADLMPDYIVEVPKDIFNDSGLHYRLEGNGYLLYSVGVNGKDDGGKCDESGGTDEETPANGWDDLVVRVP